MIDRRKIRGALDFASWSTMLLAIVCWPVGIILPYIFGSSNFVCGWSLLMMFVFPILLPLVSMICSDLTRSFNDSGRWS